MKKNVLTFLLAVYCIPAMCQIKFQRTYKPLDPYQFVLYSITATPENGYAMVGGVTSNNVPHDIYFQKLDANGDTVFTRTYGSPAYETGFSVTACSDSGFFMAGYTRGHPVQDNDYYLVRTNKWGDTLWTKAIGHPLGAVDYAQKVVQAADNNLLVFGTQSKFSGDFFLNKLSNTGSLLWTKSYGGGQHDWGYDMCTTSDNGIIMTGFASSFSGTDTNVFVIKTDSVGMVSWAKTYGGTDIDIGYDIKQTIDGGYIVARTTRSFGLIAPKIYLLKLTATGNVVWSKVYNTNIFLNSFINKNVTLDITTDNAYVMSFAKYTSTNGYDMALLKVDTTGNVIWFNDYGTAQSESGFAVMATTDGGVIASAKANFIVEGDATYIVKTDALGNSGCNEMADTTGYIIPVTTETTVTPTVTSFGITKNTTSTVGSGADLTVFCTSVGIEDLILNNSRTLLIAPNPGVEYIEVRTAENLFKKNGTLFIYDMQGQLVKAMAFEGNDKQSVYIGDVGCGVYVVQLRYENGVYTGRFVRR